VGPVAAATVQAWIAALAAFLTAVVGLFKYFRYRDRRDRLASVGAFFASTVEGLASGNETTRMASAVLLRRFFDAHTEQGESGAPYRTEALQVIAGLLRTQPEETFQKTLADGLHYSPDLRHLDLQGCDLHNAYLGRKDGESVAVDMSFADLFGARCDRASFKGVTAKCTVFYGADLTKAVFEDAVLEEANFRSARLAGARFWGARIGGACFEGAQDIPDAVAGLLDSSSVARPGAVVPRPG
jgi:Pentapeptide repeats (8 copies)